MHSKSALSATLFCIPFLISIAAAQPYPYVRHKIDRWNDMWVWQNNFGEFGGTGQDTCDLHMTIGCELPGRSGTDYMDLAALWIGAIIVEQNQETPRVSVAADGWLNPAENELWPGLSDSIVERSRLDTVNCYGHPIFSPAAIADHEFVSTFSDTMGDPDYVVNDPVDGPHRPLGLKITRTTYTMISDPCNHIYWIKYHVQNIGTNVLKNLCVGMMVEGGVLGPAINPPLEMSDDLSGYDGQSETAYKCDNDGRPADDSSGNAFTVPNVTGFCFLTPPENGSGKRVSFNWWVSNGDASLDYGPAWEDYALRDSLGLGWTHTFGTAMGDQHKYEIMNNGELDFDQVRLADTSWIASHPQDGKAWDRTAIPSNAFDVANGFYTRHLLSQGPTGIFDYYNQNGDPVYRLLPGESFDTWMAYVGGMGFHDPAHPQPSNRVIDPSLFNFSDLRDHAASARSGSCVPWLATEPKPGAVPREFTLSPVYPNPFNSIAVVRFTLGRPQHISVAVYDILGREVQSLASGVFSTGDHALVWDAKERSSGMYFVRAVAENTFRATQKVVLLK